MSAASARDVENNLLLEEVGGEEDAAQEGHPGVGVHHIRAALRTTRGDKRRGHVCPTQPGPPHDQEKEGLRRRFFSTSFAEHYKYYKSKEILVNIRKEILQQ